MKRPRAASATRHARLLALALIPVLGGCDTGFDPLVWGNFPDTAQLFSLARPDFVNRPSAYDIASSFPGPVIVEADRIAPAVFDFAVTEDEDGQFLLLPAGVFADFDIQPGLQADSTATFDDLSVAPRENYVVDAAIPADTNVVYVVRSRQAPNGCFFYGKMEVLELDPAGIVTIRALRNPNCSDRSLVPTAPPRGG